jgi:hypothetical protein
MTHILGAKGVCHSSDLFFYLAILQNDLSPDNSCRDNLKNIAGIWEKERIGQLMLYS